MKLIRVALRSVGSGINGAAVTRRFGQLSKIRAISTDSNSGNGTGEKNDNSFESAEDFEQRIFGGNSGNNPITESFFRRFDKLGKDRGRYELGSNMDGSGARGSNSPFLDGLDDSFSTLSDGMDGRLKKAATYFEFDPEEIAANDYSFRPDVKVGLGDTYDVKDLDLTKPGVRKPFKRPEFATTTEDVLKKADFRNVAFLANFLTEAGIIIKRSQTRISAKAQRKVAREIKTARAFGLMPFTTMGQDPFIFGSSRVEKYDDDEYERYVAPDPIEPADLP